MSAQTHGLPSCIAQYPLSPTRGRLGDTALRPAAPTRAARGSPGHVQCRPKGLSVNLQRSDLHCLRVRQGSPLSFFGRQTLSAAVNGMRSLQYCPDGQPMSFPWHTQLPSGSPQNALKLPQINGATHSPSKRHGSRRAVHCSGSSAA